MCFERPVLKSLFYKASDLHAALSKKRLTQVFSCEIIKNTFFVEHLRMTASGRAQDFTDNGSNSNS